VTSPTLTATVGWRCKVEILSDIYEVKDAFATKDENHSISAFAMNPVKRVFCLKGLWLLVKILRLGYLLFVQNGSIILCNLHRAVYTDNYTGEFHESFQGKEKETNTG